MSKTVQEKAAAVILGYFTGPGKTLSVEPEAHVENIVVLLDDAQLLKENP